jgi:polyhydroxyalkanoate synthesis regulator phasin
MPKKLPGMTADEESEKFRDTVRELTDTDELNPTEDNKIVDELLRKKSKQAAPSVRVSTV